MKNTIQQSKTWVYTTSFILSFNGGFINSICLVSLLKNSVGYVTGNLTLAGTFLESKNYFVFFDLILLVIFFLLGSIFSGVLVDQRNLKIDMRYQNSLIIQFIIMSFSILLLLDNSHYASYLLALVMGMQNAMTTHYGSALIRTTHMTGTTTDLGILLSRWIKKQKVEFWKVKLYLSLIFGFTVGAVSGAFSYYYIHELALCLSLIIYVVVFLIGNSERRRYIHCNFEQSSE